MGTPLTYVAVAASSLLLAAVQQAPAKPETASEVFKLANKAVVTIRTPGGQGSGVLIDSSGIVATNLHVIEGQLKVTVHLANGDAYDDVVLRAVDERKDLALLKITGFKLPSATVGDSDSVAVGQPVYAIGTPKGLELTLSEGIVSSIRDSGEGYRVIQTSAAISPGSSGGGLFDSQGRLIGITSFKARGGENLNFAMPVNYVRGLLASPPTTITLAQLARSTATPAEPARTPTAASSPRVLSLIDLSQELLREPGSIAQRRLGCSGNMVSTLTIVRERINEQHADSDEVLYVIAGDAMVTLNGVDQQLRAGGFVVVPKGTPHSLARRGQNAPIFLAVVSGPPC